MTIRSKHNDLFNYFFCEHNELSKEYLKKCKHFLENQLNNNKPKTKEFNLDQYKTDKLTLDYLNKKHSNEVKK
tara:strand:- start:1109 stop:1327 length:219 start_codon:yes stop_codon:yes gene_type:complete